MAPDRSEWGKVWLGAHDESDENAGWFPVQGDVKVAQLAVFERKITVGDATKDSDDFISSWIMGDFTGGGQIETYNEGSDTGRYWWSQNVDARSPNSVTLAPRMYAVEAISGSPASIAPLGDVPTGAPVALHMAVAAGTAVKLYKPEVGEFSAAASTALGAAPVNRGVLFRGTGTSALLFVPLGGYGHATIGNSSGTPVVTNYAASSTVPNAQAFAVWNNNLYCVTTDGYLMFTVDQTTWGYAKDTLGNNLRLERTRKPRSLVSYYNKAGEPTLHVVTDRDVWQWDPDGQKLVLTPLQHPPHPDFGYAAEIWRAGEDLWITAGPDIVKLTAGGVVVPFSGLSRDDGLPVGHSGAIWDLCAEASGLWAITASERVTDTTTGATTSVGKDEAAGAGEGVSRNFQVHLWTGTGWHSMQTLALTAATARQPMLALGQQRNQLFVGTSNGKSLQVIDLPLNIYNPRQGREGLGFTYQASGTLVTGIFDAAMSGFRKLASHFALTLGPQPAVPAGQERTRVTVSYQIDGNGTWTALGSSKLGGKTVFRFGADSGGFTPGVAFNTIQFRFELEQTSFGSATDTPVIESAVLHYTKIPMNTASYSFTVPLPREGWNGRGPGEMAAKLNDLLVAPTFLKFVHNGTTERVRVAGVSGAGATGEDLSGALQVSLIAVRGT